MNLKFSSLILSCCLLFPDIIPAGEAAGAGKVPALPPAGAGDRSRFRISAGAGYRSLDKVEFQSGSRSGSIRLPFLATALGRQGSTAGSASGTASRSYADGFVNVDGGTEKDSSTWYWGYESASQLSANGSTLTFQGTGDSRLGNSRQTFPEEADAWNAEADGAVPVLRLEWEYDLRPKVTAGVALQYTFLGFDGAREHETFAATQTQISQGYRLSDAYDTSGIVVPQAPYRNTYDGPGPLISNRPYSRSVREGAVLGRSTVSFFNRINESLDVKLHSLSFGPTVAIETGPVHLVAGAGVSVNVVDWDASWRETLYVRKERQAARVYREWEATSSGTELLPGLYLQAAARLKLTSQSAFTAFGQYDWSDTLDAQVGPSHFHIDPSGWTVGGMIGIAF